ncbi:MAG: hypothetical protein ACREVW_14810, partial [Burkholderiales bacterium]
MPAFEQYLPAFNEERIRANEITAQASGLRHPVHLSKRRINLALPTSQRPGIARSCRVAMICSISTPGSLPLTACKSIPAC